MLRGRVDVTETALDQAVLIERRTAGGVVHQIDGLRGRGSGLGGGKARSYTIRLLKDFKGYGLSR